jgi:methylated-DNA-[protein]-cysteine S-methyltransferase
MKVPNIEDNEILVEAVETPLGWLSYALTNKGLKASTFMYETRVDALTRLKSGKIKGAFSLVEDDGRFRLLLDKWNAYFKQLLAAKESDTEVPVDDSGWTEFAKKVYHYMRRIPAGQVLTYGDVAAAVGSPGASRAVGTLMKKNPIPPVVPCHRVVGSGGKIGGFSAQGGTGLKISLLELEGTFFSHGQTYKHGQTRTDTEDSG